MDPTRESSPKLTESFSQKARRAYTTPARPGSLGGLAALSKALKDDGKKTTRWARGFDPYTLHRPAIKKFKRRKTIVRGPFIQAQADLVDVSSHSKKNRGIKFLLTIVDAFSRHAWVEPLPSKRGIEVAKALEKAIGGVGFESLQTDKGKEFDNVNVEEFLKRQKMKRFTSENDDIKASLAERFNRTLRQKIHTYLTWNPSDGYLNSLNDMVDSYNSTPHGTIGMAPIDVDRENAEDVFIRLYEEDGLDKRIKRKKPLYRGDHVRVGKTRLAFKRGYTPNWTTEIFVIRRRLDWIEPIVYEIEDLSGEKVSGTFYARELQRVSKPTEFKIEKVIKRRGKGSKREYYVKWLGYPDSFNSWVPESDFVR